VLTDPHLWWYVTRASAMIAWVLATLSVVWGVLMSTRLLRNAGNAAWLQDLHRYFAGAGIVMVVLHLVSLSLDGWLAMTPAELFIPFATDYRPVAVAIGILAFYLLVAIQITSWFMTRLPKRLWRGVHLSAYVVIIAVAFHAGLAGTDVGSTWYLLVSTILIVVGALAALLPAIMRSRGSAAAPAGTAPAAPTVPGTRMDGDPAATVVLARGGQPGPVPLESRPMIVTRITREADQVLGIRLVPVGGGMLPPWRPGAHVTLHLPNGLQRQYSLCGDPADRGGFEIAVLRTPDSAGGSQWVHENLLLGTTLVVDGPLHHFELIAAQEYLFVAGGIGITPLKTMVESLPERRPWRLLYLVRSNRTAAFARELRERFPDRVTVIDTSTADPGPALDAILASSPATVYCCGPASLMARVERLVPPERLHLERFVPLERHSATPPHETVVTLARSGRTIVVPPGVGVLTALEGAGAGVTASCRKGVCGSCEVRVVDGRPEHLDSVLSDAEKDELGVMYPCVSRAATPQLVLDL
jgi:ferredoxin-NADP reductase/DMSO/TMAO reductase YedYZ heme-binding membrane subunit